VTFEELKQVLFVRGNFGMKLGLERMREALALLADPHLAVPVLHVAGTNGKGSTCAFTEAALRAAGLKTGLYTSPHLVHFCERIRIGGEGISEQRAANLLGEIVGRVPWALREDGLTFFELVTLMGFLAFAQERVQVAVVEVGLGGRLDATNVVEPLACAIASIGLDHVQWLGPTLQQVAAEKAGIFKRGVPAVSAGQTRAAAEVLARRAAELEIPLWRPGRDYVYESRDVRPFCYEGPDDFHVSLGDEHAPGRVGSGLALAGHHQRANAALACALLQVAAGRGLPVTAEHVRTGLRNVRWPGRLEVVGERPLVIVDGAHNPAAAHAVARALPGLLDAVGVAAAALHRGVDVLGTVGVPVPGMIGRRRVQLVFAAMGDKDHEGMLRELLPLAAAVHFCAVDSPRAAEPQGLKDVAGRLGVESSALAVYGSVAAALEGARRAAGVDGVVVCCGSLYLVGEVQAALRGRLAARMPSERL
jgi:dihydrofolate synthase/folylpolyglutamate synthase